MGTRTISGASRFEVSVAVMKDRRSISKSSRIVGIWNLGITAWRSGSPSIHCCAHLTSGSTLEQGKERARGEVRCIYGRRRG
jgi:hypothetical protein